MEEGEKKSVSERRTCGTTYVNTDILTRLCVTSGRPRWGVRPPMGRVAPDGACGPRWGVRPPMGRVAPDGACGH